MGGEERSKGEWSNRRERNGVLGSLLYKGGYARRVKETKSWQLQAIRSAHLGTTNDDIIARWINGDAVKKTIVT